MTKLKSMVQFVEEQREELKRRAGSHYYVEALDLAWDMINHAELLSQPPNIGMFVPAVCENGVWRMLEELETCCSGRDCGCIGMPVNISSKEEWDEYQQAKANVIFKGFEQTNQERHEQVFKFTSHFSEVQFYQFNNGNKEIYFTDFSVEKPQTIKIHTIEDLVKFNLEMV